MPPRIDFKSQRLFVEGDLRAGIRLPLEQAQTHHLVTVLRMESGARLLAFNGRDGEWQAQLERSGKREAVLIIGEQTRLQSPRNDLTLFFAPLRKERLDWLVEKAVEMGAGRIAPVITEHTQHARLKADRLGAIIIEAAQQCGVLAPPMLDPVRPLAEVLSTWEAGAADRTLVFCDEQAPLASPTEALAGLRGRPLGVLIGPEGGFSMAERSTLLAVPYGRTIALGPRILRAETAVVAALVAIQMAVGDWTPS